MSILVSAIEVGSVRAILPVCLELIRNGEIVYIEKKGHFLNEQVKDISLIELPEDDQGLKFFFQERKIKKVLFSVNVHDSRPLKIARIANNLNIPTIHVLDYWNGYRSRMELDGLEIFLPSVYLVPDNFARQKAIEEGIPEKLIKVTGQPALASVGHLFKENSKLEDPFIVLKNNNKKIILFVLEPVEKDQGKSYKENINYRGYTEKDVLTILMKALFDFKNKFSIILIPHPRQDINGIKEFWRNAGGESYGFVYTEHNGQRLLPFVSGVIGMASTLLFESWLVGKNVLSIQPGTKNNPLEMLSKNEGFKLIDKHQNSKENIVKWLNNYHNFARRKFRPEIEIYNNSTQQIIDAIKDL